MNKFLVNSAIKYNDGTIEVGRTHSDIIQLMAKLGVYTNDNTSVQGFVDETGKFHDRASAAKVAIRSGQVAKDFVGELYSEDIWRDDEYELED